MSTTCRRQSDRGVSRSRLMSNVSLASVWRGLRSSGRLFAASCYGHGLVRSGMRDTGTGIGKLSFLKFPSFPLVPPPFNVNGRRLIPCLISVGVCASQLLFGDQAIREFVKLHVGLSRGHPAN